ncbi:MAG: alanyl-tRNA synthetase [Pseudomonadota bacterium]
MSAAASNASSADRAWIKRFGLIGFAFFFVKGLLWLAAPLVFYHFL